MDSTHENELAPYVKTYQLSDLPFSSSTAQSSYYTDADRKQYLNHLLHLVQSSDLIQVVVGEKGSGKSTLAQKFIQQAGPGLRCCHIKASPGLSEQDLLTALAACLDLPDNLNSSVILELLWEQGFNLQRNDLTPVILIDDAQNLQAKTLDTLLQLQNIGTVDEETNESPWRIILFTYPSQTLDLMDLNTPLHFIELTEFSEQQTADYLYHRLRAVGLKQASPFTKKDIAFIHKHAEGNLHQMHQLAHQVLLEKQQALVKPVEIPKTEPGKIKMKIKPAAWLSMLAVVVLTIVLFFQDKINQLVETDGIDKPATISQGHELPQPQEHISKKVPDPVLAEIVIADAIEENKSTSATTIDEATAPTEVADVTTTTTAEEAAAPPAVIDVTKATTVKEAAAPTAAVDVTTTTTVKDVAAPPAIKDLPPVTASEQVSKPVPVISVAEKNTAAVATADKPVAATTASVKASAAQSLASALEAQGIQGKDWIMKQPAASITAQMMASSRVDALTRQAKNPALSGKAAIYHILRNNKDWYVLVYGSHKDKESMRKSLDKLPAALRKNKPWIRAFAAVHAEIEAGKK